jgi:putative PEP-CTERM system histidine kinase
MAGMPLDSILSFSSALLCGGLAVYALCDERRTFARWVFALALIALAFEELFAGLSANADLSIELLRWQRMKIVAMAFVPASLLLFSLSYARSGYAEFVARWKWVVAGSFAAPLLLAVLFNAWIFSDAVPLPGGSGMRIQLAPTGQIFYIVCLVIFTLVLANLEKTLRASYGAKRWQIKLMILGLGCYLAFRIYTATQSLLFSLSDSTWQLTNSATLLVGCLLMMWSLKRSARFDVDIYLSNTMIYGSVAILVVGLYLLLVGLLAAGFIYFAGDQFLPLLAFLVFLAFISLGLLLFSTQARQRATSFITRHLKRSTYDYRRLWIDFSERTAQVTDVRRLCATVTNFVAETLDVPSVSIWLLSENSQQVVLGGSTSFSFAQGDSFKRFETVTAALISCTAEKELPMDVAGLNAALPGDIQRDYPDYFRQTQIRYVMPLIANKRVLGALTLSDRPYMQGLSYQDQDLLKTIADQAANALLNRKLSEELIQAKELEAFQTMSAFFVHDLKNLAGGLSLMSRNLLGHLDNPEFRRDALKTLSQSVDKISDLCARLSRSAVESDYRRVATDLNNLAETTLKSLEASLKAAPVKRFHPLPGLYLDPDQVQKVLVNLLLNANEAVGSDGAIEVTTEHSNGAVYLSVTDNGSGMSRDFIALRLFRPFQTSKKYGLGIGLFQCKQIIEAHGGRIEVESEEGKGSTFRVVIPVNREGVNPVSARGR